MIDKLDLNNYTVVSNTCLGGFLYKSLNREFDSPFIWNMINDDEMLYFIENYDTINLNNYKFYAIKPEQLKYRSFNVFSKLNRMLLGIKIDDKINVLYPHHIIDKNSKEFTKLDSNFGIDCSFCKMNEYILKKYKIRLDKMVKEPLFVIEYNNYINQENTLNDIQKIQTKYKTIIFTTNKDFINFNNKIKNIEVIYLEENIPAVEKANLIKEKYQL